LAEEFGVVGGESVPLVGGRRGGGGGKEKENKCLSMLAK